MGIECKADCIKYLFSVTFSIKERLKMQKADAIWKGNSHAIRGFSHFYTWHILYTH